MYAFFFRFIFRYAGVPVDFEEVALDSSVSDETDLNEALLAIKRNGVALKGKLFKHSFN